MTEPQHGEEKQEKNSGIQAITLFPSITKFLAPTVDMLSVEFKDMIKEHIDSWKEKRKTDNLANHIDKTRKILADAKREAIDDNNPFEQMDLFAEWADGAQHIDANEKVIAEMWQQLLARIATGESLSKEIIKVLKGVSSREASILIKLSKSEKDLFPIKSQGILNSNFDEEHVYFLERLLEKGFVKKSYEKHLLTSFVLCSVILLGAYIVNFSLIHVGETMRIILNTYGVMALLGLVIYIARMGSWRLTWLGWRLLEIVQK